MQEFPPLGPCQWRNQVFGTKWGVEGASLKMAREVAERQACMALEEAANAGDGCMRADAKAASVALESPEEVTGMLLGKGGAQCTSRPRSETRRSVKGRPGRSLLLASVLPCIPAPANGQACTCTDVGYVGFDDLGAGIYNNGAYYDSSNPYADPNDCALACLSSATCWGIWTQAAASSCYHYNQDPVAAPWISHSVLRSYKKCTCDDNLEYAPLNCNIDDTIGCSKKAKKFIEKWADEPLEGIQKQLLYLETAAEPKKKSAKQWQQQRVDIFKQYARRHGAEL